MSSSDTYKVVNNLTTGRAVSLLVGIPFLFTNITVRLLGFSLLLAYFDTPWVLLFLGLHFCVAAFAVQLGSGQTVCGRVCRYCTSFKAYTKAEF